MMWTTLQKLNKVPDNEVPLHIQPWSSEALRPLSVFVHACTGDIHLRSLIVKVVCHRAHGHEFGDEGFDVLER